MIRINFLAKWNFELKGNKIGDDLTQLLGFRLSASRAASYSVTGR